MPGLTTGGYGPLEALARNRVNLNKVITHWADMLRVAGSLVTGQVRAYDLLRMFGREGRPTPLGQVFAESGRIAKTLHLLRVVDPVDDTCRRQMNRQLTVQESRHKLARDISHGKRGQIMQAYREGQEDQLGALGVVLNAAVLWTTRYLDAAVTVLRALPADQREHDALDEDVARLSPLKHANRNCLGRYSFLASAPAVALCAPCATRPPTPMRTAGRTSRTRSSDGDRLLDSRRISLLRAAAPVEVRAGRKDFGLATTGVRLA
ncbi:hypothetical protein GCM10010347_65230 [Streptomyces cirratus]|uniref:Tn3 transposase DDE domain-containing protein n=1 Tax=Streptomyces cirratus TaxID=68187 RepID=A0ABQ3F5G2_9ACTN|nr:hypothetical protein GCM10010347_65230 [Streptomyces cirratus]